MSEPLKVSSKDIKHWLERETSSTLIPIHEEARKLLDEMGSALEEINEASKMLLESSNKEIEKRSKKTFGRARALNKLAKLFIKRMRQVEVPREVSYVSFRDFVQQTQKALVATEVDIKNWFSRISPYFILDRRKFQGVFEKTKNSLKELQTFLREEYIKTKSLEETFQLIDDLLSQEEQLAKLEAEKDRTQTRKASFERGIAETKRKAKELKGRKSLSEIGETNKEIRKLRKDVKRSFRHLQKPFIKFRRLVYREGGLTPSESEKLRQYVRKPFKALAAEEEGYPHLKKILQKLNDSIKKGDVYLKRSRRRKAREDMDNILHEDSLVALHEKCRELATRKRQLTASTETEKTKEGLRSLRKKLKDVQRRRKRVELEERRVERDLKKTRERIEEQKNEIERNILDFLDKRISVELEVQ